MRESFKEFIAQLLRLQPNKVEACDFGVEHQKINDEL